VSLVGLPGIDDHADGAMLFLDKENAHHRSYTKPERNQSTLGERSDEAKAKGTAGAKSGIPVGPYQALISMYMLELFITEAEEVGISEDSRNCGRRRVSNFSWSDWPVLIKQSQAFPSEACHGAGSGLVQIVGLEKLVNGLSVGSRRGPAIGSDPPQDATFH
jgi:hypothetical protein